MKRFLKIVRNILLALIALLIITVAYIYIASYSMLNHQYPLPALRSEIMISEDSAVLERGRHLSIVMNCNLCHSDDMGGQIYYSGVMGTIAGPNLTPGQGGIKNTYTDEDWIRILRHGIRKDGTSMLVMPSEVFMNLSTEDMSALVSYLKRLPNVDREMPASELHLVGRALLVADKLPLLVAEKTKNKRPIYTTTPTDTLQLGQYLTEIYSCRSCHGSNFSGKKMGLPGAPPSSNLTRAGMKNWTKEAFMKTLRTGIKRDGDVIHEVMPWRNATQLTEQELNAIWSYLSTVPPVDTK
jgi:cytochrome c553